MAMLPPPPPPGRAIQGAFNFEEDHAPIFVPPYKPKQCTAFQARIACFLLNYIREDLSVEGMYSKYIFEFNFHQHSRQKLLLLRYFKWDCERAQYVEICSLGGLQYISVAVVVTVLDAAGYSYGLEAVAACFDKNGRPVYAKGEEVKCSVFKELYINKQKLKREDCIEFFCINFKEGLGILRDLSFAHFDNSGEERSEAAKALLIGESGDRLTPRVKSTLEDMTEDRGLRLVPRRRHPAPPRQYIKRET